MVNTTFEAYKVKREIKRSGTVYEFTRDPKNEFGEPEPDPVDNMGVLGSVRGLYHEQNSNVSITTGETTQVRTKKIPMVLCLWDDLKPLQLEVGDKTKINGKVFKVTGVVNIQEWSIIADISLEVVDVGISA